MKDNGWIYNPNLYPSPGCTLQTYGMKFDSERFLQDTVFDRKLIIYHGKPALPEKLRRKSSALSSDHLTIFDTTYLLLTVSEAKQSLAQLTEATAFLKLYRSEIERLNSFPRVEMVSLTFQPGKNESPLEKLPDDFFDLANSLVSIMF